MKKSMIFISFLFLILFLTFSISAQEVDLSKKGYKCLNNKIDDKSCSSLSLEENIFSVLSTGKCLDQLIASKKTDNCWGSGSTCDVKETAQAIVALKMQDSDISSYLPWLLEQNQSAKEIDWLLQVDTSNTESSCTLNSSNKDYSFQIDSNQKLTSSDSSSCFSIEDSGYWIKIKPSCYDDSFFISCDKDFSTTLFFKKGSTIHVLDNPQAGFSENLLEQEINSLCFKKGNKCDYEGTLWSTFALDLTGEDTSSYLPYLIAGADSTKNQKYLPESFLYYLTNDEDLSAQIKTKQQANKYWVASGNKYYSSAVALFPFSHETFDEKTNTINWLKDEQDKDGCWNSGSIVDTSFLLFSIWPKIVEPSAEIVYCEDQGGYCMSSSSCSDAEGSELENYTCTGFSICCDKQKQEPSCDELGGSVCTGDEVCDVSTQTTSDTTECCTGVCEVLDQQSASECENDLGVCRSSCDKNEKEKSLSCTDSSDVCCVIKEKSNIPWLWIIVFVILILAVVLFLLRKKIFKGKQGLPSAPIRKAPPKRPLRPAPPRKAPAPRRIPAPVKRPVPVKPKPSPTQDVFSKLKEIGK